MSAAASADLPGPASPYTKIVELQRGRPSDTEFAALRGWQVPRNRGLVASATRPGGPEAVEAADQDPSRRILLRSAPSFAFRSSGRSTKTARNASSAISSACLGKAADLSSTTAEPCTTRLRSS